MALTLCHFNKVDQILKKFKSGGIFSYKCMITTVNKITMHAVLWLEMFSQLFAKYPNFPIKWQSSKYLKETITVMFYAGTEKQTFLHILKNVICLGTKPNVKREIQMPAKESTVWAGLPLWRLNNPNTPRKCPHSSFFFTRGRVCLPLSLQIHRRDNSCGPSAGGLENPVPFLV